MMAERPELKPGEQEIAIMIDAETGVAGKINPGSRVNIFATFEGEQRAGGKGRSPNQSKIIVSDAKVIDVGKLTPFKEDGNDDERTRQQERDGVPITFALSAADAQRVAYAESFAEHVRLALVAPGDATESPSTTARTRSTGTSEAGISRWSPASSQPSATRTQPASLVAPAQPAPRQRAAAARRRLHPLLDSLGAAGRRVPSASCPRSCSCTSSSARRPALELIREVALRFPAVGVVLITRDTSPPLYSAAMDAGARGVLGLPLSYDELAARVGAAASWAAGVRRHLGGETEELTGPGGTVVAVTGAKGGVGTTLTAVQLALAAQASGRGSALVDMDLQSGDVASYLDVQFRRSVADLAGISDISARVLQDAVYSHESGLGLLLAPGEGERGEEVDDRAARQIVGALRARYDIVLVDCGTQLNAANAAAIETADWRCC